MTDSQEFVPIEDIKDDLIYLRDGSVSLVLTTSAVNFGLLFETEQLSIIDAFARLLNSLSFPIEIVIHSKRLDVSSYLHILDRAISEQSNPLLKNLTANYRQFVESTIKERNVLDKQFYVCINVTSPELGFLPKTITEHGKKALTILKPRRDHLISQLARLGLKSRQLTSTELVKLFYDAYNPLSNPIVQLTQNQSSPLPANQSPVRIISPVNQPKPPLTLTRLTPPARNAPPMGPPPSDIYRPPTPELRRTNPPTPQQQSAPIIPTVFRLSHPFIVEELADDFGP